MYNANQLRQLFQNKFNLQDWNKFILDVIKPQQYRQQPEQLDIDPAEGQGYFLGQKHTPDNFEIGLFYLNLNNSVKNRRVGLRQLVKPYLRYMVDAALVVFDDGDNWRLSFICDLKDERTQPKRYTFVFGEQTNYYNTAVKRFEDLQGQGITFETLKDAFSVKALTKEFYNELFGWYQWAVSPDGGIYFPNDTATAEDDFEDKDKKIIRLLTRLMFVWFIKQKDLVPGKLFDEKQLRSILKDFDPQATDSGNYYNAILQNLFFATLNRAIEDDEGKRGFAKLQGQRDVKTLYRYAEMFCISEDEVIKLFAEVPFLNGGLFECLDKTKKIDGVDKAFNYDGFSRNPNRWPNGRYRQRAFIPNKFFFDEEKGLLNILKRYNFTIEENTPNEQTVALDPELLGKVFENLLGAYNPETRETARNQSGSFYTPREIVNYMVDESIKAYLLGTQVAPLAVIESLLSDNFEYNPNLTSQYKAIADRLKAIKILDPACGSGAFPMGLLNRLIDILQKIEPEQNIYDLKLSIIENCIYGSDIQNIAAQISKLRFFISLICDCEKDPSKPNFGIPTLPNLETKFVTANSLIALHRRPKEVTLDIFADFEGSPINLKKKELMEVRHQHFREKKASEKIRLRKQDEILRTELLQLLEQEDTFAPKDAIQMAKWNPYDQNAVADFFDPEWMFDVTDGFDIVIGNPPYIQLQNNGGELAELYEPCGYKTFARTGDIYCLFYERGHQLLKKNGHLCYITSNKWMRAGYGEKTREFLANNTDPQLLIDFAGVKIFESATVDTNILLFANGKNQHKTICAVTNKSNKDDIKQLSDFVRLNGGVCNFSGSDSWVILSPIEQSIKNKIESVGVPLRDWDINIYRGVLTGYNEAFIIDTAKRDEILANCKTEDERKHTTELIRPILRGRDIKRYGYDWAGLWLINTHNGVKGKYPPIDINDYPAVKQHLDLYWDKIKKRDDKGVTPYNLRNCAYMDDFFKPKICWKAVGRNLTFAIVEAGTFLTAPASFIQAGQDNEYILAFLCSKVGRYFIYQNSDTTGAGDIMLNIQSLIKFPIPRNLEDGMIKSLVLKQIMTYSPQVQDEIDYLIYKIYGLSETEINEIESC